MSNKSDKDEDKPSNAFDNYKKLRKIGEGGYGKVFLVQHRPTKRPYVIKEIDISNMKKDEKEKALHEVQIAFFFRSVATFRDAQIFGSFRLVFLKR